MLKVGAQSPGYPQVQVPVRLREDGSAFGGKGRFRISRQISPRPISHDVSLSSTFTVKLGHGTVSASRIQLHRAVSWHADLHMGCDSPLSSYFRSHAVAGCRSACLVWIGQKPLLLASPSCRLFLRSRLRPSSSWGQVTISPIPRAGRRSHAGLTAIT